MATKKLSNRLEKLLRDVAAAGIEGKPVRSRRSFFVLEKRGLVAYMWRGVEYETGRPYFWHCVATAAGRRALGEGVSELDELRIKLAIAERRITNAQNGVKTYLGRIAVEQKGQRTGIEAAIWELNNILDTPKEVAANQ